MFIITVTRWRRKLAALLVIIVLFAGLGWGISSYMNSEDSAATAPADQNLQKDVMNQPVKVQGQPSDNQPGAAPVKPAPQGR